MEKKVIRVLLVEDDLMNASLFQEMLANIRSSVFTVAHAIKLFSALDMLRENEFDVILLDLTLPDSHGIDTFLAVYAKAPQTPIIILTALDIDELALTIVQEGAQDYLVKGQIDRYLLERSIRYAIERYKYCRDMRVKNDELERTYGSLQRMDVVKDSLVSLVSNDLKRPLDRIKQIIAQAGHIPDAGVKKVFGEIESNVDEIIRIAKNLLDVSKTE